MRSKWRGTVACGIFIPLALAFAGVAQATVVQSSAYAFKSTVPGYQAGPAASTSGSGPSSYDQHKRLEDQDLGLAYFSSDVLESESQGGPGFAEASAHTDDIEIHPTGINGDFKFSSDPIRSSINSDGDTSLSFKDVKIELDGNEFTLPTNPAANTPFSDVSGLSSALQGTGISGVMNEQGDGFINALHITLDDFTMGGIIAPVSGDLIFAHSQIGPGGGNGGGNGGGTVSVPAPSGMATFLLMDLGLGLMFALRRRYLKPQSTTAAA